MLLHQHVFYDTVISISPKIKFTNLHKVEGLISMRFGLDTLANVLTYLVWVVVFFSIGNELKHMRHLRDSRTVSIKEQLGIFYSLSIAAKETKLCRTYFNIQERQSISTLTRHWMELENSRHIIRSNPKG